MTLVILLISGLILKNLSIFRISGSPSTAQMRDPPQVPYRIPVLGNLISYLRDSPQLASSIMYVSGYNGFLHLAII